MAAGDATLVQRQSDPVAPHTLLCLTQPLVVSSLVGAFRGGANSLSHGQSPDYSSRSTAGVAGPGYERVSNGPRLAFSGVNGHGQLCHDFWRSPGPVSVLGCIDGPDGRHFFPLLGQTYESGGLSKPLNGKIEFSCVPLQRLEHRREEQRHHNLHVTCEVITLTALERWATDDIGERPIMGEEIEIHGREVLHGMAQITSEADRFEKDLGKHHAGG